MRSHPFRPLLTLGPVISRIDLRGATGDPRDLLPRAEFDVEAALEKVRPICEDVRHRGVAALVELTERFDGVRLERTRVPEAEITAALETLDPKVRAALEESIRRARLVHREQRRTDHTTQVVPGGTVSERWVPVDRVGLYVPGGLAVYPSSVVMNVVPAQEAGVRGSRSPPRRRRTSVVASTPRSWRPARCWASARCTRSAAPRRSRCSRTAPPSARP